MLTVDKENNRLVEVVGSHRTRRSYPFLPEHAAYFNGLTGEINEGVEFEVKEIDRQVQYDNGEWAREYTTETYAIPIKRDLWEEAERDFRKYEPKHANMRPDIYYGRLLDYLKQNYTLNKK